MKTRSTLLAVAGFCAVIAAPGFAQAATKLAVSYSATSDFMPVLVAKDAGIFAKHGLDVTLNNLATTALGPPALQAGSLQIASISPPLLLLANDGGLDLVAVASVGALNAEDHSSSLVARSGITIANAKDLIGKKIGRPGINSAIDIMLKKWLLDRNVPLDQVAFIESPFPRMADLLRAGQLDAVVALDPIRARIIASGAGTMSIDFFSEISPHIVAAIFGSTREWATANASTLREFRAALTDAWAFMHDHPDQAAAIKQKYLGSAGGGNAEFALDLKPADFDLWIGAMKQLKLFQQPVPDAAKLIVN